MPSITIEGPPLEDLDRKRILVREMTDSMVKAYGLRPEIFTIVFHDNPPENVSSGGELLVDKWKKNK